VCRSAARRIYRTAATGAEPRSGPASAAAGSHRAVRIRSGGAEDMWGASLVALVRSGAEFKNGLLVEREEPTAA